MKTVILSIVGASLFATMSFASDQNTSLEDVLAAQPEEVQARYV